MRSDPYLENCWQVAAFPEEVAVGRLLSRRLLDRAVVLFRKSSDNQVVAMEDRCPHRSAPLSRGTQIGDTLRCGYHGLRFASDGRCIEIPGQDGIPPKARVTTFPIAEKYSLVWIWMGDPAAADFRLIPDVHWMDDPRWVAATGYHLIAANYRLLTDNLLDLSHETYLHTQTIGNEAVADSPVTVNGDIASVRVTKEIPNCDPPPFYQYLGRLPATVRVKRWQRTLYRLPAYTVIDVGVESLDEVADSNRVEGRVINLITPATSITSHYFWAFARNFRLHEPEVTEFLRANVGRTFDEDKEMLEAQQANMGADTIDPMCKFAARVDLAPIRARRILRAAIESEHRTVTLAR